MIERDGLKLLVPSALLDGVPSSAVESDSPEHVFLAGLNRPGPRVLVGALVLFVLSLLMPGNADAQVIPPGQETRVRALFAPYDLGTEVAAGFRLQGIHIDRAQIRARLVRDSPAAKAMLTLSPAQRGDAGASRSFSFRVTGDDDAQPALRALQKAVRTNDRSELYVKPPPRAPPRDMSDAAASSRSRVTPPGGTDPPHGGLSTASRLITGAWVIGLCLLCLGLELVWRRRRTPASRLDGLGREFAAIGLITFVVLATAAYGWSCDDAGISMRYAANLADGNGLVFNLGERVQGFTNPAWVFVLAAGKGMPLMLWAIVVGVVCTGLMALILWRICASWSIGSLGFAVVLGILMGCEPFLAYATSGLETSLTNLLVVATFAEVLFGRRHRAVWWAGLAVFSRLDTILVLAPILLWAWRSVEGTWRVRFRAHRYGLIAVAFLLLGWFGFATLYFGYPLPNTWYAKSHGIGTETLARGLWYLADFGVHRWLSAIVLLGAMVLPWTRHGRGEPLLRAASVGISAQVVYVVCVGGDYMHGRFLVTPFLVAVLVVTGLARHLSRRRLVLAIGFGAALLSGLNLALVRPDWGLNSVSHERTSGWTLWENGPPKDGPPDMDAWRVQGSALLPPGEASKQPTMSTYLVAQKFGRDPRIAWLDGYGLTDPYIARCPLAKPGRAGHEHRLVPVAYFRVRGDVRQLQDGEQRLRSGDPNLSTDIDSMVSDPRWPTAAHAKRYEELRLLTRGHLWDPRRLALIPKYFFFRQSVPPIDPAFSYDVVEGSRKSVR